MFIFSLLLSRSYDVTVPCVSYRCLRDALTVALLKPVWGFFRYRRHCGSNELMIFCIRDFDTVLHSLHSCTLCLCVFSKDVTCAALTPPGVIGTGPEFVKDMITCPVKV